MNNAKLLPIQLRATLSVLAALCLWPHAPAQNGPAKDARYYTQQATKAYREKNYPAYLDNLKAVLKLRPNHPTVTYNLAGAHALAGDKAQALALLERVARMGLVYPADADEDFSSLRETDEFRAILQQFTRNKAPAGKSAVAFTLEEKGFIPESVAYDPATKSFFVGSVYRRKILRVGADGAAREFAAERDGLWSVMGMKVDAKRRALWVCTAAQPQMSNFAEGEDGSSAVLKFDLASGKLLKRYALPNTPAKHWLGDLAVNSRGTVFATDSLTPAVYTITRARDELEPLTEGAPFVSPQGLDFSADEKSLFVADYSKGLFVVDLKTKQVSAVEPAPDTMLLGIDGLYFHRGGLIAIQNSAAPHRVVRFFLSRDLRRVEGYEVVEANNPLFDEPTLGALVGDTFYYVANSQWGAVDKKGRLAPAEKLRDPVILKVKL